MTETAWIFRFHEGGCRDHEKHFVNSTVRIVDVSELLYFGKHCSI